MSKEIEEMYTVEEIAEILKLGKSTVREMAETGSLPMFKIGRAWRIRASVFQSWLIRKESENHGADNRKVSREILPEILAERKTSSQVCST